MQTACGAFIEKGLSIFVLSFKNKSVHNYCILAISMIFKTSIGIVRVMQKFTIVNICLIVVFVRFCVVYFHYCFYGHHISTSSNST